MTWTEAAPGLAATIAMWFVPGALVLRLARGRLCVLDAAAAPVLTAAVVGVGAILAGWLSIPVTPWTLAAAVSLACAAAWWVGRASAATARSGVERPDGVSAPGPGTLGLLALALALAAWAHAHPLVVALGSPDAVQQTFDGVFHLNALAHVRLTGEASTLGGLTALTGPGGTGYYPATWHAITALVPGFTHGASAADATAAANASTLVLGCLAWPLGLAALAWAVAPGSRVALLAAPLLGVLVVNYPVLVLTLLGQWPYGAMIALLPGALALLVRAVAHDPVGTAAGWGARWAPVLTAALGVALVHGAGAFCLAVLAGPLLVDRGARALAAAWRAGRRGAVAAVLALAGAVALAIGAALVGSGVLDDVVAFRRRGDDGYLRPLRFLLTDTPMAATWPDAAPGLTLVVPVLAIAGAAWALTARRGRWLVVSTALAAGLVLLAAGPESNPLRVLAGPWFTQPARIHCMVVLGALVLAALGLDALARGAGRAWHRVAGRPAPAWARLAVAAAAIAVVAVGTDGARYELKKDVAAAAYDPAQVRWGTMIEGPEELGLIDRAATSLPPGAVVLGDPFDGSAYLLARAGVEVVFPQLGEYRDSPPREVLRRRWDAVRTDPAVCAAARDLGVTHVYTDTPADPRRAKKDPRGPGPLADIDTSEGYELVDRGGGAALWRLTACG